MKKNIQNNKPVATLYENLPSILIVEDDVTLNRLIRIMLEREGFATTQVMKGADAVAAARTMPYAMILLDYLLPDLNAQQVIIALRKEKIDTPVIVMTGFGDEKIAVEIMKLGALDYIVKESDFITRLPKIVRQALEAVEKEMELKRAEREIRKNESKYRDLYESMMDAYVKVDMEGRINEFNHVFCDMIGYTAEETRCLTYKDITPEKWNDLENRILETQIFKRGYSDVYEKEYRRKDGTVIPVELRTILLKDHSGNYVGMGAIIRDISERVKAAREMEANYALLTAIINSPKDIIIFSLDKEYRYTAFNSKHREEMKKVWDADIKIGDCMLDFMKISELRVKAQASIDRALSGETFTEVQSQPTLDIFYEINWSPVYFNKEIIGAAGFIRDITDHKRGEKRTIDLLKAVQEEKMRLSALIEGISDEVWFTDVNKKFTLANPAALREFGLARDESIDVAKFAQSLEVLLPDGSQRPVDEAPPLRALLGEEVKNQEEIVRTPASGELRYRQVSSTPVKNSSGEIVGSVSVVRDITELKLAEEQQKKLKEELQQSQKLKAIGQLSSGVAHDFNNLLGGIMGHAELMKRSLNPQSPLLNHSDVIISLCQKAADLTKQLLSFARKAPFELKKIDMNAFVKQVAGLMERTIDRRVEIVVEVPAQPAFISGDCNQLENALLNIAINARDAMADGGCLTITSETVAMDQAKIQEEHIEEMKGPYVRISIADTGTGMSKEIKDRIFEPFFTTKEIGKGTGLGLASVYGCVKQHNGYITVESRVGVGTRFDLYFPIAESGPSAGPKPEAALMPGKGSLLVVDDEAVYHDILTDIFGPLGYTLHCCLNGIEAAEYYRVNKSAIDVVILDLNMPKMSGAQCFKRLKEINPGVRVIIASGYGDSSERDALKKEGVEMFIQKPYRAAELCEKIEELMANAP